MNKDNLVVINGKMASGKTTAANGLKEDFNFIIISIGTMIKKVSTLLLEDKEKLNSYLNNVLNEEEGDFINEILTKGFKENYKNAIWEKLNDGSYNKNKWYRKLTQFVATTMRDQYGDDVWVRFLVNDAMELAEKGKNVVCDDMRVPSEKKIFEKFGFATVRLEVSKQEQRKRLEKEYGNIPEEQLNHVTETSLDDAKFDFKINTDNFTIKEMRMEIYKFLGLE